MGNMRLNAVVILLLLTSLILFAGCSSAPTPSPIPPAPPVPDIEATVVEGDWMPVTVEWDRIVHEPGMVIFDYLLVVITNPNPHPGTVAYSFESEDENGIKLVGGKYRIGGSDYGDIEVPPDAKMVILYELRFALDEIRPAKWTLSPINSWAHSYGQWEKPRGDNHLQRGTPIGNPQQTGNEFFDLDGNWLTNKTDKTLEISFYDQSGRTLTRQPDNSPLVFEKFPDITTSLGHQFAIYWLEPNTKLQISNHAVFNDADAEANKKHNRATHSWNVYQCSTTCFADDD